MYFWMMLMASFSTAVSSMPIGVPRIIADLLRMLNCNVSSVLRNCAPKVFLWK